MSSRLIVSTLPPDDELEGWVTAEELAACRGFAPRRRRETLAWRAMVRRELGRDVAITYGANGAPQVDCGAFISVSHSANLVAVRIGTAPCTVDTEPLVRNFERVRRRYMTRAEEALSDDRRLPAAVWCAKEALYKLAGRPDSDFLRDIAVTSVDFAAGTLRGTIHGSGEIELTIEIHDNNIIVHGEADRQEL